MAKATQAQWDKAKALFEAGKSLREIGLEVKIPFKTVDDRSKKEAWGKGKTAQLIHDMVRVSGDFRTLETAQQETVLNEVERITKAKGWYQEAAALISKMAVKYCRDAEKKTAQEALWAMQALERGMKVSGVVPYYPTPTAAVKVDVNTEKNEMSPQLKSAASIIES